MNDHGFEEEHERAERLAKRAAQTTRWGGIPSPLDVARQAILDLLTQVEGLSPAEAEARVAELIAAARKD